MKRLILKVLPLVALLVVGACSDGVLKEAVGPNLNETPLPNLSITEAGLLTLSKNNLDTDYLMQASFIDQNGDIAGSPTSQGAQSRVV
ncbi:MAG: hypothetical protein Q7S68_00095, partial [Deltaproteobacteria bacterium]|nr:hypothetical protein [Deltaproteobacteria bacterium]